MSENEAKELRALVLAKRSGSRSGPFPPELRERLMGYVKRRWQSGAPLKGLSRELGLSDHTVSYWRSKWGEARPAARSKLRAVAVAAQPERRLTMHGPAGTRMDGLSLEEAAALWKKLS